MEKFEIEGGVRLEGTVQVSGAKNAVLPLLAVAILFDRPVVLENVPRVRDTFSMVKLLNLLGVETEWLGPHELRVHARRILQPRAPYEIVKTMRASIYVLGPLLAREGRAEVSLPGGCAFGPRPVNFHLEGLRKMGAHLDLEEGYIVARHRGLHGAHLAFDQPSVGATAHLMMVASTVEEETRIANAAKEPEVVTLGEFLQASGAEIQGLGTDEIVIRGRRSLEPPERFTVIPDRIEAGTFAVAAAITRGRLRIENARPEHLWTVLEKLEEAGVEIRTGDTWVEAAADGRPRGTDLKTAPFPGFPTDMQAQFMALMSLAEGTSVIQEGIYPDRFKHAFELMRMGANIRVDAGSAVVRGVEALQGAPVMASDLRASAALVLAGLAARGKTVIDRIYHLDRGYERLEEKLRAVGARIRRFRE